MAPGPLDIRRKKLLHRARYRGFKEADMLVGGFAESALGAMSELELEAFETLLAHNDHDIYAWIVGDAAPPAAIDKHLLRRMQDFDAAAGIHDF